MGTAPTTDAETAAAPDDSAGEPPSAPPDAEADAPGVEADPPEAPPSEAGPKPGGESDGGPRPGDAAREGPPTVDASPSAEPVAGGPADPSEAADTGGDVPGMPRTTVRITADVGEIVGADDRDYDLGTEDVVTLPEPNADVLVEKDAAERL